MLTLTELTKRFGRNTAVNGVNMEVQQGEIRGLIGPNGSGKSTLFGLISGFHRPTAGSVRFAGREIAGAPPHRIARAGLCRTFQLTSVYGDLTVAENVAMCHHLARGTVVREDAGPSLVPAGASVEDSADAIIAFMGLSPHRDARASLLPGGTQRILSIANALGSRPSLLLLDEPLAGLDATEKAAIGRKILELRQRGITILLVEHDVRSIMTLCDRVTVLNFGEVIAEDTPAGIARNEKVVQAYLGGGHAHA